MMKGCRGWHLGSAETAGVDNRLICSVMPCRLAYALEAAGDSYNVGALVVLAHKYYMTDSFQEAESCREL